MLVILRRHDIWGASTPTPPNLFPLVNYQFKIDCPLEITHNNGLPMKAIDWLLHCALRIRYPVSLPEDIATDLGITASNLLTFEEFVATLVNPKSKPQRLMRFMPRELAEAAFQSAQKKEKFGRNSLYSYYFPQGWLEFSLYFDEQSRLRRIYLQHKHLVADNGVEIPLNTTI